MKLSERIYNAGVVGAGGAGFPTHIKAGGNVEFMLANGAECEPLLHKDYEMMLHFAPKIVSGMELMIDNVNAKKGYFGVKRKNINAADEVKKYFNSGKIELTFLGDFYPSGDEYELVYEATKRLIPPHGIPLDIGCVVNNVETLYNVSNAAEGIPVTKKMVSINGAVKEPKSFMVPVGAQFKDLIEMAGGTTLNDFGIFVSGVMMGRLTFDLSEVVTKTTAGLIILPKKHYLIQRMGRPLQDMNRIGKSACDQCSYCTEFCPRYLLGYEVEPHKVMRSLVFTKSGKEVWNEFADLCCSCGLCSLYACPEDLYPREACDQSKDEMKNLGIKHEQLKEVKVHPMKEGRRVPLKMLMKKMNLLNYDSPTPFSKDFPEPGSVKILLKQHVGVPSVSIVNIGDSVSEGDLIAKVPEGSLGANIHASIRGKVTQVSDDYIRIQR